MHALSACRLFIVSVCIYYICLQALRRHAHLKSQHSHAVVQHQVLQFVETVQYLPEWDGDQAGEAGGIPSRKSKRVPARIAPRKEVCAAFTSEAEADRAYFEVSFVKRIAIYADVQLVQAILLASLFPLNCRTCTLAPMRS